MSITHIYKHFYIRFENAFFKTLVQDSASLPPLPSDVYVSTKQMMRVFNFFNQHQNNIYKYAIIENLYFYFANEKKTLYKENIKYRNIEVNIY